MNNRIGPTVKHVWNVAMYVLPNSLPLGPIQPSYPATKEYVLSGSGGPWSGARAGA